MLAVQSGSADRGSLVARVCAMVVQQIQTQQLSPGHRLPSVRQLADDCGISRDTVARAYDKLVAQEQLESRPGSGFYVKRGNRRKAPAMVASEPERMLPTGMTRLHLLVQGAALTHAPGGGLLPADWLDEEALAGALRTVARASLKYLAGFGDPLGYLPLRQQLQLKLREVHIEVDSQHIITSAGAADALHLVVMALIRYPRQYVMVEDPGQPLLRDRLLASGLEILNVPRLPDGPDLEVMRRLCELHKPSFFFCSSVLQNPTSTQISPHTAFQLLRLAEEFNLTIVEDDTYSDLMPLAAQQQVTRLASLDQLQRVIYIGSFSKTLAPGLRVGYLAASPERIEWLLTYRVVSAIAGQSITERAVYQLLTSGAYRHHCSQLRSKLDQCRRPLADALIALGCSFDEVPAAGMYLWAKLPGGANAEAIAARMFKQGHLMAPCSLFSGNPKLFSYMRFNISNTLGSPALAALAAILGEAAPRRAAAPGLPLAW